MRITMGPFHCSTTTFGRLAVGGLLTALLVACGGDSDGDLAGVDAPPTSPAASDTATAAAVSESAGDRVTALSDSFDDDQHGWALPDSPQGTDDDRRRRLRVGEQASSPPPPRARHDPRRGVRPRSVGDDRRGRARRRDTAARGRSDGRVLPRGA